MYRLPIQVDRGKGQPVVLLHGLGNNHRSWTYVLDSLDYKRCRAIVPDLLGFGDAPKPDVAYSVDDHAAAVIASLDKLNIKQAIIAGHSMGCNVAIAVAVRRPDLVKQLILLGAPLYSRLPRGSFWERITKAEGTYFTIFSTLTRYPDVTLKAAQGVDVIAPLLKGMEITEATWPAFRKSLQQTIMQVQSYQEALSLKVPTTVVYGRLDVFIIKRTLRRLARKNRRFVRFETALGPHEITPFQGKKVAEQLMDYVGREDPKTTS